MGGRMDSADSTAALSVVRTESRGAVLVATIDRPDALNALNRAVIDELTRVVQAFEADSEHRVLVLAGAGDKAFVAGADIAEMADLDSAAALEFARHGQRLTRRLAEGRKITIAAVQGFALGGGCELAMSCDIILAGPKARFGQPEVKLGVIPGFGGTQRLARLVGAQRAKYLALSGRMIRADEALRMGLVAAVVDADSSVLDEACKLADEIASQGWLAIQETKRLVDEGLSGSLADGLDMEARSFGKLFDSYDQAEGMRAFLAKRPAQFRGE